jgi:hypothetical protein
MKMLTTLCLSALSLTALAYPLYDVDENHVPPQEQQEEQVRDMDRPTHRELRRDPQSMENQTTYGSKVGANPEAADKKPKAKK